MSSGLTPEPSSSGHGSFLGGSAIKRTSLAYDSIPAARKVSFVTLVELNTDELARVLKVAKTTGDVLGYLEYRYKLAKLPLETEFVKGTEDAPPFVGTLFHQIDNIDDLLDAVLPNEYDENILALDDVEILLFIVMHSFAPVYLALLLSNKLGERYANAVDGSMQDRKKTLFSNIASGLAGSIPISAEFSKERLELLGPHASDPLQLAIFYTDRKFMAEPAAQALVNDIWGPSELSIPALINMVFHPFTYIPWSLQLRWLALLCSHLTFALLIWAAADGPTHDTYEPRRIDVIQITMQIFTLSKFGGEVLLYLEEVSAVMVERPGESHLSAMTQAGKRFVRLDPWNVIDTLTTVGMIVAMGLRYAEQVHAFSLVTVLMIVPAFLRLLHVLDLHRVLGPLLQAIAYQIRDIATFLSIFGVTWVTFSVCFTILFFNAPSGEYADYVTSIKTLYSASLGSFDFTLHQYPVPITPYEDAKERIGTVMLIVFVGIQSIVLLNLIVAIMSNTYTFFNDNSKNAYLFARARSILTSLKNVGHNTLPPPLNMVQFAVWLLTTPVWWAMPESLRWRRETVSNVILVLTVWPALALLLAIGAAAYLLRGVLSRVIQLFLYAPSYIVHNAAAGTLFQQQGTEGLPSLSRKPSGNGTFSPLASAPSRAQLLMKIGAIRTRPATSAGRRASKTEPLELKEQELAATTGDNRVYPVVSETPAVPDVPPISRGNSSGRRSLQPRKARNKTLKQRIVKRLRNWLDHSLLHQRSRDVFMENLKEYSFGDGIPEGTRVYIFNDAEEMVDAWKVAQVSAGNVLPSTLPGAGAVFPELKPGTASLTTAQPPPHVATVLDKHAPNTGPGQRVATLPGAITSPGSFFHTPSLGLGESLKRPGLLQPLGSEGAMLGGTIGPTYRSSLRHKVIASASAAAAVSRETARRCMFGISGVLRTAAAGSDIAGKFPYPILLRMYADLLPDKNSLVEGDYLLSKRSWWQCVVTVIAKEAEKARQAQATEDNDEGDT